MDPQFAAFLDRYKTFRFRRVLQKLWHLSVELFVLAISAIKSIV